MPNNTRWTSEDVDNLVYMYKKNTDYDVMAAVLNRTPQAVYCKLWKMDALTKQDAPVTKEVTQLELIPEPKKAKKKRSRIVVKDVYVLTRSSRPSFITRLVHWFSGAEWKPAKEVVHE